MAYDALRVRVMVIVRASGIGLDYVANMGAVILVTGVIPSTLVQLQPSCRCTLGVHTRNPSNHIGRYTGTHRKISDLIGRYPS